MNRESSVVSSIPSSNIRINGVKYNLAQHFSTSSVNYFILSYLTSLEITRLGQLSKRFYELFVPTTLWTATIAGTVPTERSRQLTFAIQLET